MSRLRTAIAAFVAVVTAMSLASVAAAADTTAEAEAMALSPASAGGVVNDPSASGGKALRMWWNSSVSVTGTVPASTKITVVAKGQDCFGSANMTISLDGKPVHATAVTNGVWAPYSVSTTIPAGVHTIAISFINDFDLFFLCDRALYVDKVSVVAGPTEPPTEPPASGKCAQPPPSSTLPLAEEFNGPAGTLPNSQVWNQSQGAGYLEVNTNRPENGSLDGNGNLAMTALKERIYVWPYGWYEYTSSSLHTFSKFEMCYGTMRARIKIPNGKGMRPAFFLVGSDITTVGWPKAGEIDIIDVANRLAGSAIHGTGFDAANEAPFDITAEFHEFWLRWEPNKIVTGVDNQEIATYTPSSLPQGASWPFNDHPMFVALNLSVGGFEHGGPPDSTTQFPATMLLDWVRYTPPA